MRNALAVTAVLFAAFAGGLLALWGWSTDHRLSAGTISVSSDPFHKGSLDLYVPLVDWGVRFPGVRLPLRLRVEVKAIDREAVQDLATGGTLGAEAVRGEARDAIARHLRGLAGIVFAAALALGALVAVALRSRHVWSVRRLVGVAALGAALWVAAIAFLLAPRGRFDHSDYYARGADIPVALRAVQAATESAGALSEELDGQLVGLARLVQAPAGRQELSGLPRLTIASDLHNNVVALPTLRRASGGGPVLFVGDLTDRGSPIETAVLREVVRTGRPFVFVAGNHDSDRTTRALIRRGAVVLHQRGRRLPEGRLGPVVNRVAGVRVAGYADPNQRRSSEGYIDNGTKITREQQADFLGWLLGLVGKVDVVMVHHPALAEGALKVLRDDPPDHPLLIATGHTHEQDVLRQDGGVAMINGGTVGAGGTGNLTDGSDIGLAVLTYDRTPFEPLAVDLVRIDPGDGSAEARRLRLDSESVEDEVGAG